MRRLTEAVNTPVRAVSASSAERTPDLYASTTWRRLVLIASESTTTGEGGACAPTVRNDSAEVWRRDAARCITAMVPLSRPWRRNSILTSSASRLAAPTPNRGISVGI
jgi:hypothetical protein